MGTIHRNVSNKTSNCIEAVYYVYELLSCFCMALKLFASMSQHSIKQYPSESGYGSKGSETSGWREGQGLQFSLLRDSGLSIGGERTQIPTRTQYHLNYFSGKSERAKPERVTIANEPEEEAMKAIHSLKTPSTFYSACTSGNTVLMTPRASQ